MGYLTLVMIFIMAGLLIYGFSVLRGTVQIFIVILALIVGAFAFMVYKLEEG